MTPSPLGLLRQACIACRACPLRQGAVAEVTPVFGRRGDTQELQIADPDPAEIKLVIVGEAPGPQENTIGRPFIGPAGEVLEHLMLQAGIDTGKVWITNAVACWPHGKSPHGRAVSGPPSSAQIATCSGRHLGPQLDHFPEAKIVVALGMSAATAVLSYSALARSLAPMLAFRPGEVAMPPRVWPAGPARHALVTYHPSYLARRGYRAGERAASHEDADVVLRALVAAGQLAEAMR